MAGMLAHVHAALEGVVEERQFPAAVDQWGVEAPGMSRHAGIDLDQAVRRDGLARPFEGERLERLGTDRVPCESERLLPDEDLAGGRRTLEPLGDVHRGAGDEGVVAGRVAGDDLAGVDAGAHLDADAHGTLELVVQAPEHLV
jgi:hypothetical protein